MGDARRLRVEAHQINSPLAPCRQKSGGKQNARRAPQLVSYDVESTAISLERQTVSMFRIYPLVIAAAPFFLSLIGQANADDPDAAKLTFRQAHAHNDYLHDRPLLDALDNGFCSVEADIFLVDDQLLVAHTRRELSPDRTLRGLYLEPLRKRIRKNGGSVHGDEQPLTLLIDIKTEGQSTYRVLHKLLTEYHDIFTSVTDGKIDQRAVTAVISGNRPIDAVKADSPRYVGIDGRLSDLESDRPAHLMPLISDRWGSHFRWRGKGEMSATDREKLTSVLKQAHAKGRLVRFWAIPDKKTAWSVLQKAGVDMINTDDLPGLSAFLGSIQE